MITQSLQGCASQKTTPSPISSFFNGTTALNTWWCNKNSRTWLALPTQVSDNEVSLSLFWLDDSTLMLTIKLRSIKSYNYVRPEALRVYGSLHWSLNYRICTQHVPMLTSGQIMASLSKLSANYSAQEQGHAHKNQFITDGLENYAILEQLLVFNPLPLLYQKRNQATEGLTSPSDTHFCDDVWQHSYSLSSWLL